MLVYIENIGVTVTVADGSNGKTVEAVLYDNFFGDASYLNASQVRIVEKASNRKLGTVVGSLGQHCTVSFALAIAGGKGGFGSNLRSSKAKGGSNNSSKTYYRDLKTGVTVGDLERLKRAQQLLEENSIGSKQEVEKKKEKLAKSIQYYQELLDHKNKRHLDDDNQKLLEEVDEILEEMQDSMSIVLFSEDEGSSESDMEDTQDVEDSPQETTTIKEPSYKHFFD